MFKIAYGAGHNKQTRNGIPRDFCETPVSEWYLNDRLAQYFAQAAQEYEVALLRVDDPQGLAPVDLQQRCKKANDWGADFFLSIHHNAGINGGKGGGLVAFSYKEGTQGAIYRDAIYKACIEQGGLIGNRWDPTLAHGYYVLKNSSMPAVLMEYGFMDSKTDIPVILTDEYAQKMAYATMEGIARVAGLKKKAPLYRVQVGAFKEKQYAESLLQELKKAGYEGFITEASA